MLDLARGTATIMFVCVAVAAAAVTVAVVALPNRRVLPTAPRIAHPINCKAHALSLIGTATKRTTTWQSAKYWMICAKDGTQIEYVGTKQMVKGIFENLYLDFIQI